LNEDITQTTARFRLQVTLYTEAMPENWHGWVIGNLAQELS